MKPSLTLIAADEARRILTAAVNPIGRRERVAVENAVGRVLAQPLIAGEPVPAFARAMMDGYAVRAADVAGANKNTPVNLRVADSVTMGQASTTMLLAGQAMAIATGGHLPAGADAVVMIEKTNPVAGDRVAVLEAIAAGRNVMVAGEDFAAGSSVIAAGRRVRALDIAGLAAFGVREIEAFARPRVAILSSGTEICAPDATPGPGQVRDVNQPMVAAQAESAGCIVTRAGIVPDDPAIIEGAIKRLLPDHDVVLLSGGSSIGGKDFTGEIFARFGSPGVLFHGINCRPGKPTLVARAGEKILIGLPGVPASAAIIFEVFVRPALRRLGGEDVALETPSRVSAFLAAGHVSVAGREDYLRVRLVQRAGQTWAEVLSGGPAMLSGLLGADGLAVVDAATERLPEGALVTVNLLH